MKLARRDKPIGKLVNFLLRFASRDYRDFIGGAIRYGMDAAAYDHRNNLPKPPHWSEKEH